MKVNTWKTLLDFDGQVITDYFQRLVERGKINAFKSFQHSNCDTHQEFIWVVEIKKRWMYECKVVVYPTHEEMKTDLEMSSSRRCVIVSCKTKSQTILLSKIKSKLFSVMYGAKAERHVESIVNNELELEGGATIHSFPSSKNDDLNGADLHIYLRPDPKSDVIRIPLQIKSINTNDEKLQAHFVKFPHIPVLLYKNDSEYIKSEIVRLINEYVAKLERSEI